MTKFCLDIFLISLLITVKSSDFPSHGPTPIDVFLVQESIPLQNWNIQSSLIGSHPSRALSSELFPAPVGPTMTIRGSGKATYRQYII